MENLSVKEYVKKFLGASRILICTFCGWYASNPNECDLKENCAGCGKSYQETKSKIEYI